jgi:hypothetical protein
MITPSLRKIATLRLPAIAVGLTALEACGGRLAEDADGGSRSNSGATVTTRYPDAGPLPGQATCKVVITRNIPITSQTHVELCSSVAYSTNPPSGGDHWPEWSAYRIYDVPVAREMYVHNLEHGAVVLGYRCEQADCPDVVKALGNVFRNARDTLCGPAPRVLMTQDMKLATPIAAAAWGATYTATCIDEASLSEFVNTAIGHGSEAVCASGTDIQASGDPCGFLKGQEGSPSRDAGMMPQ